MRGWIAELLSIRKFLAVPIKPPICRTCGKSEWAHTCSGPAANRGAKMELSRRLLASAAVSTGMGSTKPTNPGKRQKVMQVRGASGDIVPGTTVKMRGAAKTTSPYAEVKSVDGGSVVIEQPTGSRAQRRGATRKKLKGKGKKR
jgi:hypothetical protein